MNDFSFCFRFWALQINSFKWQLNQHFFNWKLILFTFSNKIRSQIAARNAFLPDDLSTIFESPNLFFILEEARANRSLAAAICDKIAPKIASKTIVFHSPISTQLGFVSNSSILITDFKLFSLVLEVFGRLIENIEIKYNKISIDQRLLIHYYIKKHCSKSLTTLKMSQCDQDVLLTFDTSLKSVENLIISGDLSTRPLFIHGFVHSREKMSLNRIFPSIRYLTIESMFVTDPSIFEHKFPELIDLKITFFPASIFELWKSSYYSKTKPAMKNLLDFNSQIRSLTLINCNSLDYLKIASKSLKKLDHLQVNLLSLKEKYSGEPIHFRRVRKLAIEMDSAFDVFNVIRFPRLDEMDLECTASDCGKFPLYSNTLTKLTISGYSFENHKALSLRQLPYLEDLTILNDSTEDLDFIFGYIEASSYLMRVTFVNHNETFCNMLKEYDIEGWQLTENDSTVTLTNVMTNTRWFF